MPHHYDQRDTKYADSKLDRSKCGRVDCVPRITNNEQFTEAPSEQHLWRNPAIRAADVGGERRLVFGQLKATFTARLSEIRLIGKKVAITLPKQVQRLIGRQSTFAISRRRELIASCARNSSALRESCCWRRSRKSAGT
jgi:hypothetical protein